MILKEGQVSGWYNTSILYEMWHPNEDTGLCVTSWTEENEKKGYSNTEIVFWVSEKEYLGLSPG